MKEKLINLKEKLGKQFDKMNGIILDGVLAAFMLIIIVGLFIGNSGSKSAALTMSDARVTLGNYKGIEISMEDQSVSDEDVDQYIDSLLTY